MAARLAAAYGTCAWTWLGDATEFTSLGRHFGAGLTAAEVDYCAEHEWAQTADDVLWRRTKLGLRMTVAQRVGLEQYLSDRSAA
jgi:glycerol-3-phosphate dehydrogenase